MALLDLSKVPKIQKVILAVVFGVIVIVVGYRGLLKPQLMRLSEIKLRLKNLETQVTAVGLTFSSSQAEVSKLAQLEVEYRAVQERLGELKGKLPRKRRISQVVDQLASQVGADAANISFGTEVKHDIYIELPIKIHLKCRYMDLGRYLRHLEDAQPLIKVNGLKILAEPEGRLGVEIDASTYVIR